MKSVCVSVTHTIPRITKQRSTKAKHRRELRKKVISELERNEYVPKSLTMQIKNTNYVNEGRIASRRDEAINMDNPTIDGFNLNALLAKKLISEGLFDDILEKSKETSYNGKETPKHSVGVKLQEEKTEEKHKVSPIKPLSSTRASTESSKLKDVKDAMETICVSVETAEKRKNDQSSNADEKSPPVKKRRTPIVFDVDMKEEKVVEPRKRTESASSDNHVIVTTADSLKYDALTPYYMRTKRSVVGNKFKWQADHYRKSTEPAASSSQQSLSLPVRNRVSQSERKPAWCRAFPLCRYGAACAFTHPRCKFAAACTRRGCAYSHALSDLSHVVPAANYKSITAGPLPSMCKFYPSCSNPVCTFFHPKACRYGTACLNKLECPFYHAEASTKWRYPA